MPHDFLLFADDWSNTITAVCAALAGLLVGLGTSVGIILKLLLPYRQRIKELEVQMHAADQERQAKSAADAATVRRDEYEAALAGFKSLIAEHEKQAGRREQQVRSQQLVIETLQSENIECREEQAENRNAIYFLYDAYKRLHAGLVALGHDPGEQLKLPAMKDRAQPSRAVEFMSRQVQTNTGLIREMDEKIAEHKQAILDATASDATATTGGGGGASPAG